MAATEMVSARTESVNVTQNTLLMTAVRSGLTFVPSQQLVSTVQVSCVQIIALEMVFVWMASASAALELVSIVLVPIVLVTLHAPTMEPVTDLLVFATRAGQDQTVQQKDARWFRIAQDMDCASKASAIVKRVGRVTSVMLKRLVLEIATTADCVFMVSATAVAVTEEKVVRLKLVLSTALDTEPVLEQRNTHLELPSNAIVTLAGLDSIVPCLIVQMIAVTTESVITALVSVTTSSREKIALTGKILVQTTVQEMVFAKKSAFVMKSFMVFLVRSGSMLLTVLLLILAATTVLVTVFANTLLKETAQTTKQCQLAANANLTLLVPRARVFVKLGALVMVVV